MRGSLQRPRWLVGLSVAAALMLGTATYWLLAPPFLAGAQPVESLSVQLGYWQLVVGITTLVLAVIFGGVALSQLEHARQARAADREAERRRVLFAVYEELRQNWMVLLTYEGRLEQPKDHQLKTTPRVVRSTYDAVQAGPLWGAPIDAATLAAIAHAYNAVETFKLALAPRVPWQALLGGAGLTWAWSEERSVNRLITALSAAALMYLADVLWKSVSSHGDATVARSRVAEALNAIARAFPGDLLTVADLERHPPPGFAIRSPRSPDAPPPRSG